MSRPIKCRRIDFNPETRFFKPAGIPVSELEVITLALDELEAVRLADFQCLYHEDAAQKMNVSRQTFGNIISAARNKIADALINGKAIKIEGGFVDMIKRNFICSDCKNEWALPFGTRHPGKCPQCQSININRSPGDNKNSHQVRRCRHQHNSR